MNYQHAHPKLFMVIAVILALSGVVLVLAGIAGSGGSPVSYSTNFGGYTTESWALLLSGILCVLFGTSRAFYLWKFLATQRRKQHEKRA
jgi:drug/metabolite transporter (DMT)-like permease